MTELELALRSNPLFRNRFCASTTIREAVDISKRYGITTSGIEVLKIRALLMPELAEAECLMLTLKSDVESSQ